MQEADRELNETQDLSQIMPSKYAELVKAAQFGDTKEYWLQQKSIHHKLQNQPYVNVISILETDQPLVALSRQIFLSETIEKLTGQFISEKMVKYRGFLLNWEKVLSIFSILFNISKVFSISKLSSNTYRGFTSVQDTFEDLWGSRFPINVMRPGIALKQLDHTTIPKVMRSINVQRKLAKKVSNSIESSDILKTGLKDMAYLSNSELVKKRLTGPIARASGVISPLIDLPIGKNQKTSYFYTQFAYGKTPSPLRFMEICYRELILALERMVILLPKFQGTLGESTLPENSGQLSTSYPITFGVNHLTIELEGSRTKYVNFIPFEVGNVEGISQLLVKNSETLTSYILSFLNPEISFD